MQFSGIRKLKSSVFKRSLLLLLHPQTQDSIKGMSLNSHWGHLSSACHKSAAVICWFNIADSFCRLAHKLLFNSSLVRSPKSPSQPLPSHEGATPFYCCASAGRLSGICLAGVLSNSPVVCSPGMGKSKLGPVRMIRLAK